MDEETFVREKFKSYYASHWTRSPHSVSSREFGFGSWTKTIESRHYAFANEKGMNSYLQRNVPFFISYSEAFYRYPAGRPIQKKDWNGGEVVFDIDANELGCECVQNHGNNWVCDICMARAKECAMRLIDDFLVKEFKIPKNDIEVNFSGNRGYHIHVTSGYEKIKGYARKEIADYVNGNGIEYDNMFVEDKVRRKIVGPRPSDGGWKGKIAGMFVHHLKQRTLESLGITKVTAKKFYDRVDAVDRIGEGNWEAVHVSDKKKFFATLSEAVKKEKGCFVDEGVTFDTSKLIRMPDSIHGKTGLLAQRIPINDFAKYDWTRRSVIFNANMVELHVIKSQKFTLMGKTFGPYENETVGLPEYAAVYLLCKKAAVLSGNEGKETEPASVQQTPV
jgi:DNA primase small subunit